MKHAVLLAGLVLAACASPKPAASPPPPAPFEPVSDQANFSGKPCVKSGCSGSMCVEQGSEMMTTCQMKPEYACYQSATCERQADKTCGWTQTEELTACLASPPPL